MRGSRRPNRNCNILTPLLWPSALCLSRSPGLFNCWLSLLRLIQQLPWWGFPYHISSITPSDLQLELSWLLSWLSYIIQCPLSRLLDLWNHMFDRHQEEITVMQFTGHSLPVHQSMSVPWEFFFISSHFISQFPPTRFPLITAIRMSPASGASPWNGIFGRVEGQNTTLCYPTNVPPPQKKNKTK